MNDIEHSKLKYAKHCIDCGASGAGWLSFEEGIDGVQVFCRDCQEGGEIRPTHDSALEAWNQKIGGEYG